MPMVTPIIEACQPFPLLNPAIHKSPIPKLWSSIKSNPSPGSLRSPPSPQGRGLKTKEVTAFSLGERVARGRRFYQPERAG